MAGLEDMIRSAVPGGNIGKPLMIALLALLASGALSRHDTPAPPVAPGANPGAGGDSGGLLGGLGGLLASLQKGGLGDVINSWIGSGPNHPIAPGQLGTALGPSVIKMLAQRSGLSEEEITHQLSQILPGVVDKLTPNGRVPTPSELSQMQ
jgi:uncharacterized protein YidB (DUF937 family)